MSLPQKPDHKKNADLAVNERGTTSLS